MVTVHIDLSTWGEKQCRDEKQEKIKQHFCSLAFHHPHLDIALSTLLAHVLRRSIGSDDVEVIDSLLLRRHRRRRRRQMC